jgi:hypothetical protein
MRSNTVSEDRSEAPKDIISEFKSKSRWRVWEADAFIYEDKNVDPEYPEYPGLADVMD